MPQTPDRKAGDRSETATIYDDTAPTVTTVGGEQRYTDGVFELRDAAGSYNPLGVERHKSLRQLIHFIEEGPAAGFASGAYKETTRSGALITNETWYTDNGKTEKIVQLDITYSGIFPATETWRMYDTDGTTVLVTLVDTISYSGAFESNRTRTWS